MKRKHHSITNDTTQPGRVRRLCFPNIVPGTLEGDPVGTPLKIKDDGKGWLKEDWDTVGKINYTTGVIRLFYPAFKWPYVFSYKIKPEPSYFAVDK